MHPSDFDDATAAVRIRAAQQFLHAPTQELVDAFCKRWSSPSNFCVDTRFDPATDTDDDRYRAMAIYDDLNAAYIAGMKELRTHPQGVALVLAGFGNGGERSRAACLKGMPTTDLVATLEAFAKTDPVRAEKAAKEVLAILSSSHDHRAPLESLLGTFVAPPPKKKQAPKKGTGPLQVAMDGQGNLDEAIARTLLADPPTRAKGKRLAERLLVRVDLSDADGASRTLEVAWAAHSAKGPRNPGARTARMGLELAAQQKDVAKVVLWLERLRAAAPPSQVRDILEAGELAPFALHEGVREGLTPKLPASSKSIHPRLQEHLLPTLTLRPGRTLHAAQATSAVGKPWLPAGRWPRDAKGVPMLFLVQLDFAELPTLPGFPDAGLLLLFVPNDSTLGLRFGADNEYAAVFLPDPEAESPHDHAEARTFEGGHRQSPLTSKHTALAWKLHLQPPIPGDRRFEVLPGADGLKAKARDQLHARWRNPQQFGGNHRLGGYADFVQGEDPRKGDTEGYVHLLSLDSYDEWGFMFGDGGLAHFFIAPEDLAACRFDRMLWFWDCA